MACIFLHLLYRNLGLYPLVMADEWAYSLYSRLLPFSHSAIPSYLFLWIYRQTNHAGSSFADCARLFNCIFFVSAAPFIYAITQRVLRPTYSAAIALLSIVGPINSYTAYFMPESMYFFGFWFLSWLVLGGTDLISPVSAAMIGATLAALSMVKIHAIFLIPAACIAAFVSYFNSAEEKRKTALVTNIFCIIVAAIVLRLAVGYLFAGKAGLYILGEKYGSAAHNSMKMESMSAFVSSCLLVLKGHLAMLALLFAVPLASIGAPPQAGDASEARRQLHVLRIYAVATLGSLLLVTGYYTVSVAAQPHESIARLHLRYYDFALPLLLMVAAGDFGSTGLSTMSRRSFVPGILIAVLALYAAFTLRRHYLPNIVDSPELWAVFASRRALLAIGCANLACLALWMWNRGWGAALYLFVAVPLTIIISMSFLTHDMRSRIHPDTYEIAAQAARNMIGAGDRSRLAVVGSDEVELYRAVYQIDSATTSMVLLPENSALETQAIPANDRWILMIGDHTVPAELQLKFRGDGYRLFRRVASQDNP